VKKRTRVSIVM